VGIDAESISMALKIFAETILDGAGGELRAAA
jgi:hypothetical protein